MSFMEFLKFPTRNTFPATGDNNRLYIDLHSKKIYYWDHGAYKIASPDITEQESNKISRVFSYAGIVATVALLPTEGIRIGDVYIVEQDEGHEQNSAYVWSGTQWIEIGGDMEHLVAISWAELKALRDASELIPGAHYRITDYTCTTVQVNTQSAGHQFDIIVTADDVNKLNENARACLHAGDTYFSNSKLEAWQLKYCLDNDTTRFAWADDSVNGKGVIYRMIDEFNNDVPYDFKNIQFSKSAVLHYTFVDDLIGASHNNKIEHYFASGSTVLALSFNTLSTGCYFNTFGKGCGYNALGADCHHNTFGTNCTANTFDTGCYHNTFVNGNSNNIFGNDCSHNTFIGPYCSYNTFGNDCRYNVLTTGMHNVFGNSCSSNFFSESCYMSNFADGCSENKFSTNCSATFGAGCIGNILGNSTNSVVFGANCSHNVLAHQCYGTTLGTSCSSNVFGNESAYNVFGNYCSFNIIDNDCSYLTISDNSSTQKKYIHVENGTQGASSLNLFDLYDSAILDKAYQVTFKKDADGHYVMAWLDDYDKLEGKYKDNNLDAMWKNLPHDIDGGIW